MTFEETIKVMKHGTRLKKKRLNIYQKNIVDTLWKSQRPLSTMQIAKRLNINWKTARKHLRILKRKGAVTSRKHGMKVFWCLH